LCVVSGQERTGGEEQEEQEEQEQEQKQRREALKHRERSLRDDQHILWSRVDMVVVTMLAASSR